MSSASAPASASAALLRQRVTYSRAIATPSVATAPTGPPASSAALILLAASASPVSDRSASRVKFLAATASAALSDGGAVTHKASVVMSSARSPAISRATAASPSGCTSPSCASAASVAERSPWPASPAAAASKAAPASSPCIETTASRAAAKEPNSATSSASASASGSPVRSPLLDEEAPSSDPAACIVSPGSATSERVANADGCSTGSSSASAAGEGFPSGRSRCVSQPQSSGLLAASWGAERLQAMKGCWRISWAGVRCCGSKARVSTRKDSASRASARGRRYLQCSTAAGPQKRSDGMERRAPSPVKKSPEAFPASAAERGAGPSSSMIWAMWSASRDQSGWRGRLSMSPLRGSKSSSPVSISNTMQPSDHTSAEVS
mmetsp:Transcript_7625/g.30187  ORF Transcript_7625/g.30187 Transcript_7625/m.30187 type:complete len:381 (-) Transcript_7625:1131-2273(-)